MSEKERWVLLGKKLNNEASREESARIEQWFCKNKERGSQAIEFIEEFWKMNGRDPGQPADDAVVDRWERFLERLHEEAATKNKGLLRRGSRSFVFSWPYRIGAAAAALLILGLFLFRRHSADVPAQKNTVVRTDTGIKKNLLLPDGTRVWMNAGSTLSYDHRFSVENRRVRLEGEAFFQVAGNPKIPFVVTGDGITVKVLGTAFNIRDYRDDDDIQATLISGEIQVSLNDRSEKKILLSPNEKLTAMKVPHGVAGVTGNRPHPNKLRYQVQTIGTTPADSVLVPETAWMDNKLAFVQEPFEAIARQMERYYHIHICFQDEALKQVIMSGVFEKESLKKALTILQMMTDFTYHQVADTVFLSK